MNPDQTNTEQNFITCATKMQKFMHEYALISSGEFDEIGHMAMKHPVPTSVRNYPSPGYGASPPSVGQGGVCDPPLEFPNEAS